ncbi:MAG: LemA family protein [Limisphaerales bacterium]
MKKLLIVLGGLIAIFIFFVIVVAMIGIGGYNRLNVDNQNVNSKWAQVQNDYQRRADLIPNLVNTVSGAANFEKSTLTDITEARASVGKVNINPNVAPADANTLAQFDKAQGQLSSALSRLLVVVERYPDLKANANFRDLQAQLEGTENRITVARRDFNDAVQSYDTRLKSFPTVLYAGMMGFKEKPYFTATPGAETAPKVQFDFNSKAPAAKP